MAAIFQPLSPALMASAVEAESRSGGKKRRKKRRRRNRSRTIT